MGEGAAEHCPRPGCVPLTRWEVDGNGSSWAKARPNRRRTVIVSITEPGRKAKLPKGWHDMLRLAFQDYDPMTRGHVGPANAVVFTPTMAARLARFARKHRGANIVVHCAAGISRSGAVVEALLEAFPEYEDRGWQRHPNTHVKVLLKRALGLVPLGYVEELPEPKHDSRIRFTADELGTVRP